MDYAIDKQALTMYLVSVLLVNVKENCKYKQNVFIDKLSLISLQVSAYV